MNADGARRGAKRPDVAMNPAEVTQLLDAGYSISLTTIGADGWPHLTAMWYALVDDQIVFMTHRGSQKHYNLQRDHRVVGLVEQGRRYEQLRGVQFRGLARETIDEPARVELAAPLDRKYSQHPPPDLAHTIRRRAVYTVTVLATSSWDHRKLGAVVVVTAHRNPYRRGHHGVDGEREPTTARAITVGWPVRRSVLRCGGPRTATPCVVG